MEQIGAVVRGPRGRYRPGMLLVSLSRNVAIGELLHDASHDIIMALAERLNVTVHIGVLEGSMVTYVAKVSTPTSFPTHTRLGAQLEPYCSALGKVLLAALPREQLEGFLMEGELIALTPHTISDPVRLCAEIERVREQGFALDLREHKADMSCVAVAIREADGRVVAAISITDQADKMTPARQAQLREALLEAADTLGQKIYPALPFVQGRLRAGAASDAHRTV
jgi:DNA-binding IclR family transcriptional regulator